MPSLTRSEFCATIVAIYVDFAKFVFVVLVDKKHIRMQNFATKEDFLMHFFSKNVPVTFDTSLLYGKRTLANVVRLNKVLGKFRHCFGVDGGYIVSSPGRLEIVGNHTDHNGGQVVGCTVNIDIVGAFDANDKNIVCVKSSDRHDIVFNIDDIFTPERGSKGMVKGVLAYLANHGYRIGGLRAFVNSNVPVGSGISSSAAFQVMVGTMMSALYNDNAIPKEVLAAAGQYAENVYFGKPCGLLDQTVVAVGGMVLVDFSDGIRYSSVQSRLPDMDFVLINTGGSHASLTELYAAIPQDMFAVAKYFGCQRLCQVAPQMFYDNYQRVVDNLGEVAALRAKHFFEENARVRQLWQALQSGDEKAFVDIVNASGESSSKQLKNCSFGNNTAIDDAVSFAKNLLRRGAARVHGGGFAGTVLCVVPKLQTPLFCAEAVAKYGIDNVRKVTPRACGTCVL